MKVLHCSWIPERTAEFIQLGDFWLWVEQENDDPEQAPPRHPRHLPKAELIGLLENPLGIRLSAYERRFHFQPQTVLLPSPGGRPAPAPEFEPLAADTVEAAPLAAWEVDARRLSHPVRQLGELRFLAHYHGPSLRAGSDLLFWHYFTQSLKFIILKDRYIPALYYRQLDRGNGAIYAGFEIVADQYERLLNEASQRIPPVCTAAGPRVYEPESLLRHCAEVLIHRLVAQATSGAPLERKIRGTLLAAARDAIDHRQALGSDLKLYRNWQGWRQRLRSSLADSGFKLLFRLREAVNEEALWRLEILAASRSDPSWQWPLVDYWAAEPAARAAFAARCGAEFERNLLLALGQAAHIYPPLWAGLDQAQPDGIDLGLEQAFSFLREEAWVLEDAGFGVLVPAWWTPEGRRRARIRLHAGGPSPSGAIHRNALDLTHLIAYRFELALGDEHLDQTEWESLVESKTPLVRFRGQWLALDREKMREMLDFLRRQQGEPGTMSLPELIRRSAEEAEVFEIEPQRSLAEMLQRLRDHRRLEPAAEPPGFTACLREYQKRGLAWIAFLESVGLNGCLADDMGLGKTIQVLARLLQERAGDELVGPSLLLAPTSVIGNWKKELERFAPSLRAFTHHGQLRLRDGTAFRHACQSHDVVITSYALARKDEKLLTSVRWRRVVLDEAQNIKNPVSGQTRAVLRLTAEHRLALTGTPVENRLLDLWSIFNFLNPGYLGKQNQFRQRYELPIQRDNDSQRAEVLRRLIEPFVLRRVKTDPDIIRDLPEKVENRQFCNLCREQAALYEAVVRDTEEKLQDVNGINRQGLILSTLTRLKQICNHPAQFLHDGSSFDTSRSPKLDRLTDMLGDVIGERESALVFTQFAEIGSPLQHHLRETLDCPVYYLHGAVAAAQRERMIGEFQAGEGEPAVFILSLRAGGVGITLTKANHVFHFDRWWNPAVEDQATDRAFRIGQRKNVFVHKFITLGTLEERIDRLIEEKKQVASLIVGNDESWLARLDNETFKELIALNHQAVID